MEDVLALASLPLAASALLLARFTHQPRWDGVGSVLIGIMLMGFAGFLGWEIKRLILGRGLSARDQATILRILRAQPGIRAVANISSAYFGPETVLLAAEAVLEPDLRTPEAVDVLAKAERALIRALPVLRFVYLEPSHPEGTPTPVPAPARAAHEPV